MNRPQYQKRHILLVGEMQKETAIQLIKNAPLDPLSPIEFVIREAVKVRKETQNSLLWASALKDIAEQVWLDGRQYSDKVWHQHFKELFLPEEYQEGITKDGYVKWDYLPNGDRRLVGSTTELSSKGFGEYMDKVYAYGGSLGVLFRANPNERY